jgi:hypothetical protein
MGPEVQHLCYIVKRYETGSAVLYIGKSYISPQVVHPGRSSGTLGLLNVVRRLAASNWVANWKHISSMQTMPLMVFYGIWTTRDNHTTVRSFPGLATPLQHWAQQEGWRGAGGVPTVGALQAYQPRPHQS